MIGIKVREDGLDKAQTALLVIGEFENGKDILGSKFIDHTIKAAIAEVIQNNEFKSTFGSCLMLHLIGRGPIRKIMLMGLGKKEKFTNEKARVVAGKAALEARKLSIDELIVIPFSKVDDSLIEAISEGL